MIFMRWGPWPALTPLLFHAVDQNPSIKFYVIADQWPAVARWPTNAIFRNTSVRELQIRLQHRVCDLFPEAGCKDRQPEISVAGSLAKISDIKPMMGVLLRDVLQGCGFWGIMQEDVLFGSLRHFLTETLLAAYDTISPIPSPHYSFGPLMLYRNTPQVNELFTRSRNLSFVLGVRRYTVFDEWWGPLIDDMPTLIDQEARAGRLRAFAVSAAASSSGPHAPWICDNYAYPPSESRGCGLHCTGRQEVKTRHYDDTTLFTWRRRGRSSHLWPGFFARHAGMRSESSSHESHLTSSESTSCAGEGPLLAVHMHGSKLMPAFANLSSSTHLQLLVSSTSEFLVSKYGVLVRSSPDAFAWFSGLLPKATHTLVAERDLDAALAALMQVRNETGEEARVQMDQVVLRALDPQHRTVRAASLPADEQAALHLRGAVAERPAGSRPGGQGRRWRGAHISR